MFPQKQWRWLAQQNWNDIFFIHFPVPKEPLLKVVPSVFQLEIYQESAWISVVLFKATNSRFRNMPYKIGYPEFYQLNVRTYVTYRKERGVYFFSLYANSIPTVLGGNIALLPFKFCKIYRNENQFQFIHKRKQMFIKFEKTNVDIDGKPSTLPYFLTERNCAWIKKGNRIFKVPILHKKWRLKKGNAYFNHEQVLRFLPAIPSFTERPLIFCSSFKHTKLFPYEYKGIDR